MSQMGEGGAGPHDSVSGLMDAAISAKSAFICSCLPDRAYDCGIANACDAITHAAIAADNLQQAKDKHGAANEENPYHGVEERAIYHVTAVAHRGEELVRDFDLE